MLRQLVIRDLVVIESLNLEFEPGMNVLTGETGTGKSILIDALGLILGDRADTALIRDGVDEAEITAIIDICDYPDAASKLAELDIEHDREVFLRRVIKLDGRSRAYINGTPVPIQSLRELGERLVDIHGQHAHQSLLKHDLQRQLLDHFGGYDHLLDELQSHYRCWHASASRLAELNHNNERREDQLALIRYQVDELEAMNLTEACYQESVDEHQRLANANRIAECVQFALNEISQTENAIAGRIARVYESLRGISEFDPALGDILTLLDTARIQVDEAGGELRRYFDNIEINPEQLQRSDNVLAQFHETARKHKVNPKELFAHFQRLDRQLQQLRDNAGLVEDLLRQNTDSLAQYRRTARELSRARSAAAVEFAQRVTGNMHDMGMRDGVFKVEGNFSEDADPSPNGLDNIEFLVTTNPGQTPRSINKVASGGELSRISLAIYITAARDKGTPIMVFDEVDAGIGGGVAEIIGRLLCSLAEHKQIFCVTHLAQVASFGQHHYRVNKFIRANRTYTGVDKLDSEQRVEEIARMLGGVKITGESRAHASEMLNVSRERMQT